MDDKLIVTVLGAGASANCGYPLAKNLFPQIGAFGESLGPNCTNLKTVIGLVIKKAEEFDCTTPDDLAFQMHQRRGGGMARYREAWRTLSYARIATDAYFLSLEHKVTGVQLQSYKDYWHQALGSYSDEWSGRFPQTRHRLLSFNYDRMPELALYRYFPRASGEGSGRDIWGPEILNTGLSSTSKFSVIGDRFCYLKAHGSIGVEPIGQGHFEYAFGERIKHYIAIGTGSREVADNLYFTGKSDEDGFPAPGRVPLLAFPADKQRIEAGEEDYNLKEYLSAVRPAAERAFANAEEVRVIGYSFQAPDKDWLLSLIRLAPKDARLILHNPAAPSICKILKVYDRLDFESLPDIW